MSKPAFAMSAFAIVILGLVGPLLGTSAGSAEASPPAQGGPPSWPYYYSCKGIDNGV